MDAPTPRQNTRRHAGDMRADGDTPGVIAPPLAIFAVPLVAGLLIDRARPRSRLHPKLAGPLGMALIGAAAAVALWAQAVMMRAKTSSLPYRPTAALVEEGPFRYSRNPMYVAFSLAYVGAPLLARASTPLLLLPLALVVMMRGVVKREERYFARRVGGTFAAYARNVPRWL